LCLSPFARWLTRGRWNARGPTTSRTVLPRLFAPPQTCGRLREAGHGSAEAGGAAVFALAAAGRVAMRATGKGYCRLRLPDGTGRRRQAAYGGPQILCATHAEQFRELNSAASSRRSWPISQGRQPLGVRHSRLNTMIRAGPIACGGLRKGAAATHHQPYRGRTRCVTRPSAYTPLCRDTQGYMPLRLFL